MQEEEKGETFTSYRSMGRSLKASYRKTYNPRSFGDWGGLVKARKDRGGSMGAREEGKFRGMEAKG